MGQEAQNLKEYVENGCEIAFTALVRKHAGMVFGTAFRRTADRELAEEISQTVFAILARKAHRLNADGTLAGWLHRTTLLQTRNFIRQEQRHRKKMNALTQHESNRADQRSEGAGESPLLEVLDEAIDQLPGDDRRVVLLRFFDGLSVREIAEEMGKSEVASQKQSHRALQKLSGLLKRKGIAISAGALVSQIVPITSKAAHADLAASLSHAALAGAPSIAGSTLVAHSVLTFIKGKTLGLATAAATVVTATIAVPLLSDPDTGEELPLQADTGSSHVSAQPGKSVVGSEAKNSPSRVAGAAVIAGSPNAGTAPGSGGTTGAPLRSSGSDLTEGEEDPFGPEAIAEGNAREAVENIEIERYKDFVDSLNLPLATKYQFNKMVAAGAGEKESRYSEASDEKIDAMVDRGVRELLGDERFELFEAYREEINSGDE